MTDRTVTTKLKLETSEYLTGVDKTEAGNKRLTGSFKSLTDPANKAKLNDISKVALGVGGALVAVAGYAVKASYAFDKQMSEVRAVSGATQAQLGQLRDAAIEAGKLTAFSATDAAKAEAELAKAGVSTADILGGALKGSLSLAAAGQMDLADAATISAQAMNVFRLRGSDVTHIADVLASAANASAADMSDLGMALKQGGLVAQQTGLTLEQTTGVLAAFADRALIGSDAGTSLKTMLQALQNPSQQSAALMQKLGISAYDAQGNFRGIAAVAQNLQDSLGKLTAAQRAQALAQIFGSDATRSASILYQLGAQGVDRYTAEVNKNGAAAQTAATKMDNLSGDVEQLKGSLETLAITSSGGVTSGLRVLTQGVTGLVNAFISLPPPVGEVLTILSGVSGGALLVGTGLVKAKSTINEFTDALKAMGPGGEKAAGALGKITSAAGKATLVGGVVLGVYEGFRALGVWSDGHAKPVALDIDALAKSLEHFAVSGKAAGELVKDFGPDLGGLVKDMDKIMAGAPSSRLATSGPTNQFAVARQLSTIRNAQDDVAKATSNVKDLDTALAQVASQGGATQAGLAFDKLTASLLAQGKTMPQIIAMFPKYADAAAGAATANSAFGRGLATTSQQAGLLAEGMSALIARGETLDSVFKSLNGANIDAAQADIAFQQSLDDIAKTLGANIKSLHGAKAALDDHTQAGRDDMSVVLQGIKNAEAAAQATYNQTQSVDAASKAYDAHIGALRRTLAQAGLTKAQIDKLLKDFAQMPPAVATTFSTPGLAKANDTASGYARLVNSLDGTHVSTTFTTRFQTKGTPPPNYFHGNRYGGVYTHAADGVLRDAAVYSAKSPARYAFAEPATQGELFAPKSGNLARTRSMVGYAVSNWWGGRVDWGQPATGGGGGGGGSYAFHFHGPVGSRLELETWLTGAMDSLRRKGRV